MRVYLKFYSFARLRSFSSPLAHAAAPFGSNRPSERTFLPPAALPSPSPLDYAEIQLLRGVRDVLYVI